MLVIAHWPEPTIHGAYGLTLVLLVYWNDKLYKKEKFNTTLMNFHHKNETENFYKVINFDLIYYFHTKFYFLLEYLILSSDKCSLLIYIYFLVITNVGQNKPWLKLSLDQLTFSLFYSFTLANYSKSESSSLHIISLVVIYVDGISNQIIPWNIVYIIDTVYFFI